MVGHPALAKVHDRLVQDKTSCPAEQAPGGLGSHRRLALWRLLLRRSASRRPSQRIPDALFNAPSEAVAKVAMQLVDRLQDHPPGLQCAGLASVFLAACRVHRINPHDVLTSAANMMADTIHGERPEFRALRLYAEHELK